MKKIFKTIDDIYEAQRAYSGAPKRVALAVAQDSSSLGALLKAESLGIVAPVLIGDKSKILDIVEEKGFVLGQSEILHEADEKACVRLAVKMCHDGEAQVLMKGGVKTPDLLRVVLDKEIGLREGKLLSHFSYFEVPMYHKMLGLTDVAFNIAPALNEKISIVENAVRFMHKLGVACPKVAALGAIEVVNEKMPATIDAALISKMNQRGQITGCLIDGPLAFDNAVSAESARIKKIESEVAGDCDLLLVPNIEVGNVLYKALAFLPQTRVAALVLGASVPIVLTSRSDSEDAKLNSILLATFS